MRMTPPTLALAALLLFVSSSGQGQRRPLPPVNPRSAALVKLGDLAFAQPGRIDAARDYFETALVVDPQNRAALVGLALVARAQGLTGKAIHYYNEALNLSPDDAGLLAAQGEVMVEKGAVLKARENLAKLRAICVTACPEATALNAAIEHGTTNPPVSAAQLKLTPVVSPQPNSAQ